MSDGSRGGRHAAKVVGETLAVMRLAWAGAGNMAEAA